MIISIRPTMSSATNTVLLGMAVCDLLTISLPAPFYIYYYTLGKYYMVFVACREILMGEGNGVASVTLFTFTLKLGPHAHSLCEARPPC